MGELKRITVVVSPKLYKEFRTVCINNEDKMSEILRNCIKSYVSKAKESKVYI